MTIHDNNYVVECSQCQDVSTYDERAYPMSAKQAVAAWNRRAERTCSNVTDEGGGFMCSECTWGDFGALQGVEVKYCPNCGAKVVER